MSRALLTLLVTGITLACLSPMATATQSDWAYWRGPNQDGRVDAAGYFPETSFALRERWKVPVGYAYSGISAARGRVLTMFTDGRDDLLAAFDTASGRELWRVRIGEMYRAHDGGHDGPPSTPVTDGATVFALSAQGVLHAVDLNDGQVKWTVNIVREFGAHIPFWGFTTTPTIAGEAVILQVGGRGDTAVAAFHVETGEMLWSSGRGTVEYRSPIVTRLGGNEQLITCTDHSTRGVDLSNGRVLWTIPGASDFAWTPVPVQPDCVLIRNRSGVTLYQLPKRNGEGPRQLWTTTEFRSTYSLPVVHEGFIYGFSGPFLVCVDEATGKRCWKSRPPGGQGVILVDNHLVVFGAKGDVVVAAASPSGYIERARLNVSNTDGYAWPAFADGAIFVRNMEHLVAVEVAEEAVLAARTPDEQTSHTFGRLLMRLKKAEHPEVELDQFLASQNTFPIVENDQYVHFVYLGDADDVGIRGSMLADGEEDGLQRLEDTNFFHRTYEIEPGARWEYQFRIDFGAPKADPLNPRKPPGESQLSEVVTSSWREPSFMNGKPAEKRGSMERIRFSSRIMGTRRGATIYLPHGYDRDNERTYPLIVVTNGSEWTGPGRLPELLDRLIEMKLIEPAIVAFSDLGGGESFRELGGVRTREYAAMLATELVPAIEQRFRTITETNSRLIFGKRAAAVASVYATLEHSDVFGTCIAISYGRADTIRAQWIDELITRDRTDQSAFDLSWNRYDVWRPQSFDVREQSSSLAASLRGGEFETLANERNDSAGWRSWRTLAAEALIRQLSPAVNGS